MNAKNVLEECIRLLIDEASVKVKRGFFSDVSKFQVDDSGTAVNTTLAVNNKPILFFHGSRRQFDSFSREFANSSGTDAVANYIGHFFTTSPDIAKIYASKRFDPQRGLAPGGHIRAFVLNVRNPYYVTEKTYWEWNKSSSKEMSNMVDQLKARGYDAIVMPSVWKGSGSGAYDVVVFDDEQIVPVD